MEDSYCLMHVHCTFGKSVQRDVDSLEKLFLLTAQCLIPALHKLLTARLTAHFHADTEEVEHLQLLIESIVIN